MTIDRPKVFISYAHESDEHRARVLGFATFLRRNGIEAILDLWSAHARQDWYAWAIREMTDADFVIVIASERYRVTGDGNGPHSENRGIQSEAALLRELVYAERATWLPKVLPVLLPGRTTEDIPLFLQPHTATRFTVTSFDTTGAEELLRAILRQPGYLPPEVDPERPALPPRTDGSPKTLNRRKRPQRSPAPNRVTNQNSGIVNGTLIQADTIIGDIYT